MVFKRGGLFSSTSWTDPSGMCVVEWWKRQPPPLLQGRIRQTEEVAETMAPRPPQMQSLSQESTPGEASSVSLDACQDEAGRDEVLKTRLEVAEVRQGKDAGRLA